MDINKVSEVKKKKGFSQLPDSLVKRALVLSKEDVSGARSLLRKYFGVFLTNKVLKLKGGEVLRSHISSKDRDYSFFYDKLFEDKNFKSVVDIGCGVNGFSYGFLSKILGEVSYTGIEAVGQLVDKTNVFFKGEGFEKAHALCLDVFDLEKVREIMRGTESPKAILMFQVIDALEGFEKDFSKKLLLMVKEEISENDLIIISMPMKSISGKKSFEAKRGWLKWFLDENFVVEESFINNERIFTCRKLSK